jgi:hypothetical protein
MLATGTGEQKVKYLVNRETKEHQVYTGFFGDGDCSDKWHIVEADAEGWIPILCGGTECPLPASAHLDVRYRTGQKVENTWPADLVRWNDVRAYRPILDKPTVKESLTVPEYDPRSVSFNLLKRLQAAHEAAQMIPDLLAELRSVLEPLGYDVVARSPFVDVPEAAFGNIAEPESDISDWRNWQAGDLVECIDGTDWDAFAKGGIYECKVVGKEWINIANVWVSSYIKDFRFHSRPERSE